MGNIFAQPNQPSLQQSPNSSITLTDEICLNPSILAHPLFLQSNDEVLSTIIESLKSLVRPTQDTVGFNRQNQRFDACFARILNDGREESEVRKDFEKINESNTTCCWNVIPKNEVFFRCLDCEVCDENTISMQCQECFSKAQHEGHRIIKGKPLPGVTYTCDCGRPDMIKEEAFCPKHQHKEQTLEEDLQSFPQTIREKYTEISKKVVYGIVCLFEIREKAHNKRVQTLIDALLQTYIEKMLRVFCFFPIKVSKSFFLVLEDVMQSNFDSPNNMVWHDCEDLKDQKKIKDCDVQQYHACTCSILGCLLRFSRPLHKAHQAGVNQVLVGCSSQKRFQSFLYKEAYRYVAFLLGNPTLEDDDPNKNNSTLIKLISAGRLIEEAEIDCLQNLIAGLRRTVDGYLVKPTVATLEGILHIGVAVTTFLDTEAKVSEAIVEKTNLLNELLDLLAKFKANSAGLGDVKLGLFEHNIDYRRFNQSCTMERCLYEPIAYGIKKIGKLDLEKRDYLTKDIAKTWFTCFQNSKMALDHQRLYKGEINTVAGLERVFSSIVLNNIDDITKENVEGFLNAIFKDTYPSNLAANTVGGVLNTLGVMRFTDILMSSQPNTPKIYYNITFSIFETDMLLIQLMTMLVRPEDLFSLFTTKFFSYSQELKDFCLSLQMPQSLADHPHSRQMTLALEDYLKFLVYLMNDELSLTNLLLRNKVNKACSASQLEKICEKVLRNILVTRQWTDISRVKAILHLFVFDNNLLPTDNVISKITMQDGKNHKIKLKDDYVIESDPYMFYKFYYFQREEQNLLATTTDKKDIVSGKFYKDLPVYLKTLQHNVFQSQLPQFLSHILNNFSNDISRLLQPALKLVLFNLQVMDEALENPTSDIEGLKKKVEQYYLDKKFSESLNKILAQEDYKECEACIQIIQGLVKKLTFRLSSRHQSPDKSSVREIKESVAEEKKRLAKEKMEKMKQQFAKKQALFAEKNEELLVKSPAGSQDTDKEEEKVPESEELVCQYCLDKISQEPSSEDYGVPIYVEFTNNFYKTGEVNFEEQNYSDLNKANWWPVVSSCNHSYHRRCFDLHFQNSRGPQNLASKLFMNEYESQCALCKTLCNNFLVMNKDQTSESSSQYNLQSALKIQNLLTHLRDKLVRFQGGNNENQQSDVELEEILRRSYEYFTESFYLHEKPQAIEDALKVQVSFTKAFKSFAQDDNKKPVEGISLFKTVCEKLNGEPLEKIYPESILKSFFFDLIQEKSLTSESEPEQIDALIQKHLKIIKEFVALSLVNLACPDEVNKPTQLQDIAVLYKENTEMLDKAAAELLFPLEKILITYCLNKCVLGLGKSPKISEFCNTIFSENDDLYKLDLLLKQAQIPLTFEKLVQESLSLLEALPQPEHDLLSSVLTSEDKQLNIAKVKLAPQYVNLPETYMEFIEKYIRQRCKICDKHNPNLLHNICLICGEPMCAFQCHASNNTEPGNLSKHASKYHMGLGLFYGIDHHAVTVIKNDIGLLFEIGHGYADELGQYLKKIFMTSGLDSKGVPRNLEFKKFTLDDKTYEFIKKIVNNHRMGKEIFERTLQNPQGFVGMYRF